MLYRRKLTATSPLLQQQFHPLLTVLLGLMGILKEYEIQIPTTIVYHANKKDTRGKSKPGIFFSHNYYL